MDDVLYVSPHVEVRASSLHGWGVFARGTIRLLETIEECGLLTGELTESGPFTHKLKDYLFHVGAALPNEVVLALGYGSLYNHSNDPNVAWRYETTKVRPVLRFFATREIAPGEELFINYGPQYWMGREQRLIDRMRMLRRQIAMSENRGPESPSVFDKGNATKTAPESELQQELAAATRDLETASSLRFVLQNGVDVDRFPISTLEAMYSVQDGCLQRLDYELSALESKLKRKRDMLNKVQERYIQALDIRGAVREVRLGEAVKVLHVKQRLSSRGQPASAPAPGMNLGLVSRITSVAVTDHGLLMGEEELSFGSTQTDGVTVAPFDLLLSIYGETRGQMTKAPPLIGTLMVDATVLVLRAEPHLVDPHFLYEILRHGTLRDQVNEIVTHNDGSADLGKLQELVLPLPEVNAQRHALMSQAQSAVRIVPFISRLKQEIQGLEIEHQGLVKSRHLVCELRDAYFNVMAPHLSILPQDGQGR